jgi:alpha-D-ribose 1-methylphosphonate 5-triphosphate diphosphatase PhnM
MVEFLIIIVGVVMYFSIDRVVKAIRFQRVVILDQLKELHEDVNLAREHLLHIRLEIESARKLENRENWGADEP